MEAASIPKDLRQKCATIDPMGGRLLCLLLMASAMSAQAEPPRWSVFGGGEGAGQEDAPGHGFFSVKYTDADPKDGTRSVELHTDTLRLEWSRLPLGEGYTLGVRLTGELGFANLVPDYFLDGERRVERGLFSSYIQGQAWVKGTLAPHLYGTLEVGGRRWVADRTPKTNPALVLPADTWSLEPRLHLTWWHLVHDAGWSDPHRLFPRLNGFAAGVSLGLDWFSDTAPWGALDPDTFNPVDPRNAPDALQWVVYQWVRAGGPVGEHLRWEAEQSFGHRTGPDDRTRWPAGGQTPYAAPLAGAYWAYFHADSFVSGVLSGRHKVSEGFEWGPFVNVLDLDDPRRRGEDDRRTFWGAGLAVDWRMGPWQIDLRGGYSPTLADAAPAARPWSVFLNTGWGE